MSGGNNAGEGPLDVVLRSRRVVLPADPAATVGVEQPAAVGIRDGRIAVLGDYTDRWPTRTETDLGDLALLPGLVDSHVHVNEPGRTEWEGFASATRAAAAGGVTTLIDMPLNSIPPTTDVDALSVKRSAAAGKCRTDVGFWGGSVPDNQDRLAALHQAGVFGFKCFTAPSGVDEFPPLSWAELLSTAHRLAAWDGLLIVHAEDPDRLREAPADTRYAGFLDSRPPDAELHAVARLVEVARETGVRLHVLHISAAAVIPIITEAQRSGLRITGETCPHYLTLTAESIPDGATEAKCCPPVRSAANRDALWHGLSTGAIGCVVSDHSPSTPQLKRGDFRTAWGGIASVQLGLPLVWTEARSRGFSLAEVVGWMATGPAALVGLPDKGRIAVGCAADLVAFAPDEQFVVDPAALHHRHPVSPYGGRRLTGVVHHTWLHGAEVTQHTPPTGRLLTRPGSTP